MLMQFAKIGFIVVNLLLLVISAVRVFLPFYFMYGNELIQLLNYDRHVELTPFWMVVLVPWDVILAFSGIRSILKNDREQIFENAFRLSIFGLVIIWFINGLGERFQVMAPVTLKRRIKQYDKNPRDKMVVDAIHTEFKCCGYSNMFVWKPETGTPSSCCKGFVCNGTNAYTIGCATPLKDYTDGLNLWLLFTNFPFIELLVSLWSCLLTDYLPAPEVIFELGDEEPPSPPPTANPTVSRLRNDAIIPSRKSLPILTPQISRPSTSVTQETN